jgi:aspartyl protease family protein
MTENNPHHRLGKGMLYIGWILGLVLLTLYFSQWQKQRENPNAMPEASSAEGVNEVVLQRNFQHHYVAGGNINGTPVTFLVDTGATQVAVPKHIAKKLGLVAGAEGYAITANGRAPIWTTMIKDLQIGTIQLKNVRASINPGMTEDEILLGMSALKNVEFTHRDGTLTLKQFY